MPSERGEPSGSAGETSSARRTRDQSGSAEETSSAQRQGEQSGSAGERDQSGSAVETSLTRQRGEKSGSAEETSSTRQRGGGGEAEETRDPLLVLGSELVEKILECMDTRSMARCIVLSHGWHKIAGRITKEDLCDHVWEYRFQMTAPEYWRNLDPSWKQTGPPMRRYFHPDGSVTADPGDEVWGGHECTYSIITSYVGDGQIREHYVRINRWPPVKVTRMEDWSWEMANHLFCYNSMPDADKPGGTGPLFPVW
ncbi:hypothetical protein LUZ60_015000 [Juncus effusus]|nr:hypothetical protein LUZ60_015000 [Juncus effusus]